MATDTTMTAEQVIRALIQFGAENQRTVRPGATTTGIQNTFESTMNIEFDAGNRPRCAWVNTVDGRRSCHVTLRTGNSVVSYGGKSFTRTLGRIERRPIR